MNRYRWYSVLLLVFTLVLAVSHLSCVQEAEVSPEGGLEVGSEIGNRAPDFTLQTIDRKSMTLSDFRGKTVMVYFWVTSCKGCVDDLPHIQTVFDESSEQELVILAISVGDAGAIVQDIVDGLGLTFPVLLDQDGEVCIIYGRGCPTTFFIDADGIIRAIVDKAFQSPDEIETILEFMKSKQSGKLFYQTSESRRR